jgi:hypothetical protein
LSSARRCPACAMTLVPTIKNYRVRVWQYEALGEFAMAELIRQILVDEQDHQIDLATVLGVEFRTLAGDYFRLGTRSAL